MKKIALIGSTGSIGKQTLEVVRRHSDKFTIVSLAGGYSESEFLSQVNEFKPKVATLAVQPKTQLNKDTEFFFGEDAFKNAIIEDADGKCKEVERSIKAEAVKEFAERLKERLIAGGIYPVFVKNSIDNLVKEMMEGKE